MDLAARRADEQYALVWVPLDGMPQVKVIGDLEAMAAGWAGEMDSRRVPASDDMRRFALVGKAAESAVYGLHVIGRGSLRVTAL